MKDYYLVLNKSGCNFQLLNLDKKLVTTVHENVIIYQKLDVGSLFAASFTGSGLSDISRQNDYHGIHFESIYDKIIGENVKATKREYGSDKYYESPELGRIPRPEDYEPDNVNVGGTKTLRVRLLEDDEKQGLFQFSIWGELEEQTVKAASNRPFVEVGIVINEISSGKYTVWSPSRFYGCYSTVFIGVNPPKIGQWIEMLFSETDFYKFYSTVFVKAAPNVECKNYRILEHPELKSYVQDNKVRIQLTLTTSSDHIQGRHVIFPKLGVIRDSEQFLREAKCSYEVEIEYSISLLNAVMSVWTIVAARKEGSGSSLHRSDSVTSLPTNRRNRSNSVRRRNRSTTRAGEQPPNRPDVVQPEIPEPPPAYSQINNITPIPSNNVPIVAWVCNRFEHNYVFWLIDLKITVNFPRGPVDTLQLGSFYEVECSKNMFGKFICTKIIRQSQISPFDVHVYGFYYATAFISVDAIKKGAQYNEIQNSIFGTIYDVQNYLNKVSPLALQIGVKVEIKRTKLSTIGPQWVTNAIKQQL